MTRLGGNQNSNLDLPSIGVDDWAKFSGDLVHRVGIAIGHQSFDLLRAAESDLQEKLRSAFSSVSREARASVLGYATSDDPVWVGYKLGELSFAQAVVTNALRRSLDSALVAELARDPYQAYLQLLHGKELSNDQILEALRDLSGRKRMPKTKYDVSKQLKELRAMGVTEVRRAGRETINFLTDVGRHFYERSNPAARQANFRPEVVVKLHEKTADDFKELANLKIA